MKKSFTILDQELLFKGPRGHLLVYTFNGECMISWVFFYQSIYTNLMTKQSHTALKDF